MSKALLLLALSALAFGTSCSTGDRESEPLATRTSAPIAFLRGGREIVLVQPDGRNERAVGRPGPGSIQALSWSPDGRQILLSVETPDHQWRDIYVLKADGSDRRRIKRTNIYTGHPDWSPRGDAILIDDNDDGGHTLWVVKPDGSGARKLFDDEFGLGRPAWSPDGTQIAYYDEIRGWILLMNADGSEREPVTRTESTAPVWAPSKKIVFYVDRDIWVINPDGSGRKMAIKGEGEEWGFDIAPDGRTIVFAYLASPGNADLSVGDVSGGPVRRLTESDEWECCPSWSSDGRSLAFTRYAKPSKPQADLGPGDIYLINADGTGERNLTNSPADDDSPAWSPKG